MNSCTMTGRLTADPVFKTVNTAKGPQDIVTFRIASDRPGTYGDNKKTDFIDCYSWFEGHVKFAKYLAKGRLVRIAGVLEYEPWEKDGVKHSKHNINLTRGQLDSLERGTQAADNVVDEVETELPPQQERTSAAPRTQTQAQTRANAPVASEPTW